MSQCQYNGNAYKVCVISVTCVIKMVKQNKARFGLTMSPDLLKLIDEKRGLIPRATYIEDCLRKYLDLKDLKSGESKC